MRELDLLSDYLVRLRQEKLESAHHHALTEGCQLHQIQICAHQAQLCDRIRAALAVLESDPGKFIQTYLPQRTS